MPSSLRQQQISSGELAIDDNMQNRNTLIATEAKNILGWMIMLIHDRKLGKDTSCIRNVYHQYPQIKAFQGIEHILQFI